MKIKTKFLFLICFVLCTLLGYTFLVLNQHRNIVHRKTRYGKFCIEENICRDSVVQETYVYTRLTGFYELIKKATNNTKKVVVPKLVHYTWFGKSKKMNAFRFHHMMAVLSAHKFIKPDRIYFWHDMIPTGEYWTEVKEKVPELRLVYRKAPTETLEKTLGEKIPQMDLVSLEVVMEYGGMYLDLDVMVLKSMGPLLNHDVVMGYESPGKLCNRIIIGKPWADYFKLWHNEYSSFSVSKANYNSVEITTRLAKQYPNLIHTEEYSLTHPTQNEIHKLYNIGNLYDWRRDSYACILWMRFHNVEHNSEDIRAWNTTVGEIWRWIYYGDWKLQLSGCILDNICRNKSKSGGFNYIRPSDFLNKTDSPIDLLQNIQHVNRVVPNIVHFTWYGNPGNTFRFHHLISVLAAHTFIKTDRILFWHDVVPQGPYWKEVTEKVPELFLFYRPTPAKIRNRDLTGQEALNAVVGLEAVIEFGGIYLDLDVIILKPLDPLMIYDVSVGFASQSELCHGIIIGKAWADFLKIWHEEYKSFDHKNPAYHSVTLPALLAKMHPKLIHTESTTMRGTSYKELDALYTEGKLYKWQDVHYALHLQTHYHKTERNPRDIRYWDTTAGQVYRYIYYGDWSIMTPPETQGKVCIFTNLCKDDEFDTIWKYIRLPTFMDRVDEPVNFKAEIHHSENVVPNIVHFTLYGGLKKDIHFRFHHLLAILAAHKFLKPDAIFFWHDVMPEGPYVKEVIEKVPELRFVYRVGPTEIRGRPAVVPEHISDIVRLEAITEYGGMYFDFDAMVIKHLGPLMKYDVTMGYESDIGLCNAILIGRPWADFFRVWHREYKTFDDKNWGYHSVLLPATLARKYPNLIHTEKYSLQQPSGMALPMLYDEGKLYDWRRKNYAVHLWIRNHKTEHSPEDIKTWNTTVGELFRYIYSTKKETHSRFVFFINSNIG